MKNCIKYTLFLILSAFVYSCGNDEDPVLPPEPEPTADPAVRLSLTSAFSVNRYDVVQVEPEVTIIGDEGFSTVYQWSIKANGQDSVIGDQKRLQFISPRTGEYTVDLKVTCGNTTEKATTKVTVNANGKTYLKRATKAIDYLPAPYNMYYLFQYAGVESRDDFPKYAQEQWDGQSFLELGSFGGYLTLQFDHTVINTFGKRDFSLEVGGGPVVIQVAYDANKNGIADENEWYEIAGSEYYKSTTVKDYEMTYIRPDVNKEPVPGKYNWQTDTEFMKWTDNKGGSGYITRTEFAYPEDYYPEWFKDSETFKGTKVYLPVKDISDGEGTKWNTGTFEWGYGGSKDANIDISWAVDKQGNKVHLPGIDFVRLYNPVFCALGEKDLLVPKISNVEDLNLVSSDKN